MIVFKRNRTRSALSAAAAAFLIGAVMLPASAWSDPLGAAGGTIYVLSSKATYQEGCFPPCLCPIMVEQPVSGTFKLTHAGSSNTGLHSYAVEDVNWTVPFFDPQLRIIGGGKYTIGSPGPITLLQQRMELDLRVGSNAVEHFDSGWVPIGDMTRINVAVSIHGKWCYDRVITIDADRAEGRITPYTLETGATFQEGCWDPCDCVLYEPRPMVGDFGLVPLSNNGLFREFAVVNIRWQVLSSSTSEVLPVRGFGRYRVGGEFAVQHQLSLELWVGSDGPAHFDSGWLVGGGQFPEIDVFVSINRMVCWDRVLHVIARPAVGNVICGGIAGLPCPDGFFCKLPEGDCCCDFMGVCAPIPGACPDVWDPVCGCDGRTYSNECDADAAGVSVAYRGVCGPPCFGDADCPSETHFCRFAEGTCASIGSAGVCTEVPTACPEVYAPVCGCDGKTYGNACEASAARVSIRHDGECRTACGSLGGIAPCPPGHFCKFPPGTCDVVGVEGVCSPMPQACITLWDPVCGCDGVTYGNECEADRAGVSVAHRGECGQVCGGFPGFPCAEGFYCKLPDGQCCCDFFGICTPFPTACPDVWDPVCGCDGATYSNECEANAAGVSLDHRGPCEGACMASRDLSDPAITYCPGVLKKVRIVLTAPSAAAVLGVEDSPPAGWTVTNNISHRGSYDPVHGKVKWGPLFPPFPPALTYEVIPVPSNALTRCFQGSVSIDGNALQPICGDACVRELCCSRMPADLPQGGCSGCPVSGCGSCNDGTCEDGRVTLCEVIAYACSWMRGCNDDLSGMTRGAYIWRSGECYCWDDERQKWVPTLCPAPASGCCPASTPGPGPGGGGAASVGVSVGQMEMPSAIGPIRDKSVHTRTIPVTIEPPVGTSAVALEVRVPSGWLVTAISDFGAWDEVHRKIKWGPFFDDGARTVRFQLRPAATLEAGKNRTLRGGPRLGGVSGTVSFDGVNHPIEVR